MQPVCSSETVSEWIEAGRGVIETEIAELGRLSARLDVSFAESIRLLREAVSEGRKILVIGVGKSENVATKIAATLNSTGAPAVVLDCQNALHGDLGLVCEGDVVLALSYSGETDEMLALLPHLRRRGALLIAVTGQTQSTLARLSTVVLDVRVHTEACPLNLAPTCSTTNMLALGDALAMVLLQARGFNAQDFAALHPGGALGRRLLTRVSEIMRTGTGLARVRAQDRVPEVLSAMTRARAGAAVVVADSGELEGIFTHGDFVRSYQSNRDISEQAVERFMSRNPVTIEENQLAEEVVRLLAKNPIDDIVVVDAFRRVVGIVDIQDLSRARLV